MKSIGRETGRNRCLRNRRRRSKLSLFALDWWAEIFVVPCVAFNIDGTDAALKLATLGADFVAPSTLIWSADDAVNRIAEIGRAISGVRRAA